MRIFYTVAKSLSTFHQQQTIPTHVGEALEQSIILNPHTNLNFSSDNPYFYSISTKNITDKFPIMRNLCEFLQPGLISYRRFKKNWVIVP